MALAAHASSRARRAPRLREPGALDWDAIGKHGLGVECTKGHALEAESESAGYIVHSDKDRGVDERSVLCQAVVVHVRDRDTRQAEQVERRLALCGVPDDVADERDRDGNP